MAYKTMERRYGKLIDTSMSRLALTEIDASNGCVWMPQTDDLPSESSSASDIPPDDVIEDLPLILVDDDGNRINVSTAPIIDPPTDNPELDEMNRKYRLSQPCYIRVAARMSPQFATSGLK